jgi:hypothetical protein
MTPIPAEEEEYEGVGISEIVGERDLNNAVDMIEVTELKPELDVGLAGLRKCRVRIYMLGRLEAVEAVEDESMWRSPTMLYVSSVAYLT